jgi:hypothetical protein
VLLVSAAVIRLAVAPGVVQIPVPGTVTSVSEARGVTYLDLASLRIRTGQDLRATRQVGGDPDASSGDTAVFQAALRVENTGDGSAVSEGTDRVAVDRRTGEAVACCGEAVDNTPVRHSGLSYTFPLGTEQKTYQFFDTTARKAFPMRYVGTDRVEGLTAYRFEQSISDVSLGRQLVPGALVGRVDRLFLTAEQVYSNVRTVWVEPSTGAILRGEEKQKRVLRAAGAPDTTVLAADFAFTEAAVREAVARAGDGRAKITAITVTVPLVALALGLVSALAGAVLLLVARRRGAAGPTAHDHPTFSEVGVATNAG